MRIKPSSLFLMFILLLMLFAIGVSLSFRYVDALLAPLLVSSVIFVLAAIELSKELRARDKTQIAPEEGLWEEVRAGGELRRFGSALGWTAGFLLSIYILGFFVGIPLFAFSYMKLHRRSWLLATVFAVALTIIIYGIFEFGLRAYLYRGLVFGSR